MADTYTPDPATGEPPDEADELDEPEVEEPEVEEEPEAARAKPTDWEKRAHNQAGRAARERSRRQAAERRAGELEARLERLERGQSRADPDDLDGLIESLRDDDDDPIGDIEKVKRALKRWRAERASASEADGQRVAVEREISRLQDAMTDAETDFTADHPDYPQAATFYRKQRFDELVDAGYGGQHLQRKIADDLYGVVRMALEAGLDPAERVYALAQKRGWKAGQAQADRKLDQVAQAREAGQRPGGGSGAKGVRSWGDVAKLDGEEREKEWKRLEAHEKKLDRLAARQAALRV